MRRTARPSHYAGNAVQEQYLGELPEDFLSERSLREPIMSPMIREFAPGTSPLVGPDPSLPIPVAANNYKSAMYPFLSALASTKVVPANPYRAFLLIQNNDAVNAVFVNFGADASLTNALRIVANGNLAFAGGSKGGSFCPLEDVYIIGAAAGSPCIVMEGLTYTP
jgi:hypothetical protein